MQATEEPSLLVLTNAEFVLVDTELLPGLSEFRWSPNCVRGYAQRSLGGGRFELLHRRINGTPEGLKTDHVNHFIWDCRRVNLRTATVSQNSQNSRKPKGPHSSRYKGVSFDRERDQWRAKIKLHGKSITVGRFETEDEAAEAYDQAARKYFGEFALANNPTLKNSC